MIFIFTTSYEIICVVSEVLHLSVNLLKSGLKKKKIIINKMWTFPSHHFRVIFLKCLSSWFFLLNLPHFKNQANQQQQKTQNFSPTYSST